ncbi:MAG: SPOR domain-containing protein [Candidatus Sedimenticola sp. 6PFRAG7]
MPRDYKSRASGQRRQKSQTPGWVWFVGGLLVGLFVSGLAWLKLGSGEEVFAKRTAAPVAKAPVQQKSKPKTKKEQEPAAPKPRFDFYTILPEMEVVVPEPEVEAPAAPVTSAGAVAAVKRKPDSGYMLQMGSFRKHSDADRLKASLALVGIEAEIQSVHINGTDTFHRVRSGPYGRDQVNTLRARLKANKINSLVIKLKK